MTDKHYTIQVSQAVLDDLQERLARTRWPDEIAGAEWNYGANLTYMRHLIGYWRDRFDWRAQEARLNEFANFRVKIAELHVHFIHERGKGGQPIPLLMLHGWPSSFVQMLKLIPRLTNPAAHGADAADSFDVVVPSLIGYGFSDAATEPGMSTARIAELFHKLMTEELGYERYAIRSSDLGSAVAAQIIANHAEAIIGSHTSGANPNIGQIPNNLSLAEQEFVKNVQQWLQQEMAYAMEHSSKPQTLAYGLNNSPVGLAAWIIEKFWRWSDNNGDLSNRFTEDELLTNIMIYWVTQTINSSIRLYYESARDPGKRGGAHVPTAVLMPTKDKFPTPREWVERSGSGRSLDRNRQRRSLPRMGRARSCRAGPARVFPHSALNIKLGDAQSRPCIPFNWGKCPEAVTKCHSFKEVLNHAEKM